MQKAVQAFESACQKAKIFVENDMPIGSFHDFLMEIKSLMVERMVEAHKKQVAEAEAAKDLPKHESEAPIPPEDKPSCCSEEKQNG